MRQSDSTAADSARPPGWHLPAIVIAALLVFAPTLGYEFTFDDTVHIVENYSLAHPGSLLRILSEPMFPGNLYRPLTLATFALTYQMAGLSPFLYHLTNVLLHAAVCGVLYLVLRRMTDPRLAVCIALLFAVAPVHVEAVANISNRSELLASLFGLSALLLLDSGIATEERRLKLAFFGALSLFAAILSKESAFCYLLLVPIVLFFRERGTVTLRRALPFGIALAVPAAAYLVLRTVVLGPSALVTSAISPIDNPLVTLPLPLRLAEALVLLGRYAVISLVPYTLSADYAFAYFQLPPALDLETVSSTLAIVAIVIAVLSGAKTRSTGSLFALWFLAGMSITANLALPIGTIFADRLVYLSSAGVLGLFLYALRLVVRDAMVSLATLLLFIVYTGVTLTYSSAWRSNGALFSRQIEVSPASAKTQINFAAYLRSQKDLDGAVEHALEAVRIAPEHAGSSYALGLAYLQRRNYDEARRSFERTLTLDPSHIRAMQYLGRICFNAGDLERAEQLFRRAMALDQFNRPAKAGLMGVLLKRGHFAEAARLDESFSEEEKREPEVAALRAILSRSVAPASAASASP